MINNYTAIAYGFFLVSLFASCSTDDITLLDPPLEANIGADRLEVQVGDTVTFKDLSLGLPSQWHWKFEGGSPGESVVHSPIVMYHTAGTYSVSLTVRRGDKVDSLTLADYITVNYRELAADFTTDTTAVKLGDTVRFTDRSTGFPESWQWEFYTDNGPVIASEQQHPELVFSKAGVYSIKLTVSHPGGTHTVLREAYLKVLSANPPEADFNAVNAGIPAGGSVRFENTSTGEATGWRWTFEGGTPSASTAMSPTVRYDTPGRYAVTLEAYDEVSASTKTQEGFVLVVPNDGLVAYYPMDGSADDVGPSAVHPSVVGQVAFESQVRIGGGTAAQFDGSSLLLVPDHSAFNFGAGDFTVACWLNTTHTNRMMVWAEGGANGGGDNQTWLRLGDNTDRQIRFCVEDGTGGTIQNSDLSVSDGQWHHVVCVREGRVSRVYVDGLLIKEGTAPVVKEVSSSQPFKIGAQASGSAYSNYFTGLIDDFLTYNRALSEEEVRRLFELQ